MKQKNNTKNKKFKTTINNLKKRRNVLKFVPRLENANIR